MRLAASRHDSQRAIKGTDLKSVGGIFSRGPLALVVVVAVLVLLLCPVFWVE